MQQRGYKNRAFKCLRNSHRLRKLATIWSKHILKDGFLRLLRRSRWPLVQARYIRALRVRERLPYWHTLTQLKLRVQQVYAVGIEYHNENSYKRGFTRLMSTRASRRRRRIASYLRCALPSQGLVRCWVKLMAYKLRDYDLIARIKQKTDDFRLENALKRVYIALLGMRSQRLEQMASLRKAAQGYACARMGWALKLWMAFAAHKRNISLRNTKLLQNSHIPLLKARRAWALLLRRKLYSFVYKSDAKTANTLFVRAYFTHFRLELEARSLNRQQTKIASEIMLARRRPRCLANLTRNATFRAKMKRIVRHFSLVYKVKRRWFHRHFTHVRLQHRVRMAAKLWYSRKQCKFTMKTWLCRWRKAKRMPKK